ncbi:hypothetical protein ILYODFUR_025635 [Ilyodon furcidens]|uniref:Uncharacterized protein n=1 Tax=Ilyodon furcidens TaxID=33524 RepID=A0ABV0TYU9_9TELE
MQKIMNYLKKIKFLKPDNPLYLPGVFLFVDFEMMNYFGSRCYTDLEHWRTRYLSSHYFLPSGFMLLCKQTSLTAKKCHKILPVGSGQLSAWPHGPDDSGSLYKCVNKV